MKKYVVFLSVEPSESRIIEVSDLDSNIISIVRFCLIYPSVNGLTETLKSAMSNTVG